MKPKLKSYVFDLNQARTAAEIALNLDDGTSVQFELSVGADASTFIGQLIEQFQYAGDHMPPPSAEPRFVSGVYPTYPLRTGISIMEHPTQGPVPLMIADYGGCELGFAVDARSLADNGKKMVRRVAEERRKRGLPGGQGHG